MVKEVTRKVFLIFFSTIEEERETYTPKVKGKRELKNLECSINYEARGRLSPERCQHRQGCVGTKIHFPFHQRCIRGFEFLGLVLDKYGL